MTEKALSPQTQYFFCLGDRKEVGISRVEVSCWGVMVEEMSLMFIGDKQDPELDAVGDGEPV